jgi:hypothetical protein
VGVDGFAAALLDAAAAGGGVRALHDEHVAGGGGVLPCEETAGGGGGLGWGYDFEEVAGDGDWMGLLGWLVGWDGWMGEGGSTDEVLETPSGDAGVAEDDFCCQNFGLDV